jgi:hypothetical protein
VTGDYLNSYNQRAWPGIKVSGLYQVTQVINCIVSGGSGIDIGVLQQALAQNMRFDVVFIIQINEVFAYLFITPPHDNAANQALEHEIGLDWVGSAAPLFLFYFEILFNLDSLSRFMEYRSRQSLTAKGIYSSSIVAIPITSM